ncbi:MAG: dienelactone hydrolase family protein [Armatimonadota bacterium]|nr:dienelactone hydrolase family protein [Armatimonadota bacterium]MDR5698173.1 dienelactone hydrolase family protein [Armatimonadota bacterium]
MEAMRTAHVEVPVEGVVLSGDIAVPADARGVVLFAHGTGSGRFSPRNRFVAQALQRAGLATFLVDLLTEQEERADSRTAELRFDVDLLARRVVGLAEWLTRDPNSTGLRVGLFGASTGAAAALVAAAQRPDGIGAVVSRGGRPDLAREALVQVRAPTLLIVGGRDWPVMRLNEEAYADLRCPKRLEIVPGAGHLFEEPGALERVAELAADWFRQHLAGQPARPA